MAFTMTCSSELNVQNVNNSCLLGAYYLLFFHVYRESTIVVQKKVRSKAKRVKKRKANQQNSGLILSEDEKARRWESMAPIALEKLEVTSKFVNDFLVCFLIVQ